MKRLRVVTLVFGISLLACIGAPNKNQESADTADSHPYEEPEPVDADQDGYTEDEDCDDHDRESYPGAPELCDHHDNNCDGETDEAGAVDERTYYEDRDGDGYGNPRSSDTACSAPDGYVNDNTDCDDRDRDANPGMDEICGDLTDNDCDGVIDDWEPNDTIYESVLAIENDEYFEFNAWTGDGSPDFWAIYADDDWEANGDFMDDFYVYAELTYIPRRTQLTINLYDPAGNLVDSDDSSTDGARVQVNGSYLADNSGYYYVEVVVLSGGTCDDVYSLYVENYY